MSRRATVALALVLLCAGAGAFILQRNPPPSPIAAPLDRKPALALLTSLPLLFGEAFALDAGGSAALARLETHYRVTPVAVADAASLKGLGLLLMAHPRAQPAEVLVELDAWVRRGGRVVLLADPRLEWPSERALGDRLRPPPDFSDTGLLAHWGLGLEGPVAIGPRVATVRGQTVMTASPGALTSQSAGCSVERGGLVAICRVGRGTAVVIADADFLNVGGAAALDGPTGGNLDFLIAALRRAESR